MIESVNAISAEGWGHLLKAFLPTTWSLALTDFAFFVMWPLLVLLGLVLYFKKHVAADGKGAWRACGVAWTKCFWFSMIAVGIAYFGARDVLTTNVSGVVSFAEEYRASLPGYEKGSDGEEGEDIEKAIAEKIRNPNVKAEADDPDDAPEYRVVRFFCQKYGYIHPFFFAVVDLLLLGWFFWPGFKMKKQGIKL